MTRENIDNIIAGESKCPDQSLDIYQQFPDIIERPVAVYDPNVVFGPLTPTQERFAQRLRAVTPDAYPSRHALMRVRKIEVCMAGGRTLLNNL